VHFLGAWRIGVVSMGFVVAPLLVRALDQGLAGSPRDFTAGHLLLGLLAGTAAQPGPILGAFVKPASGEKPRGVAVGGSVVTALLALFAGALLWRRVFVLGQGGFTEVLALAWSAAALPLAAVDFLRLRGGPGQDPAP
jgi:hypothetical protein